MQGPWPGERGQPIVRGEIHKFPPVEMGQTRPGQEPGRTLPVEDHFPTEIDRQAIHRGVPRPTALLEGWQPKFDRLELPELRVGHTGLCENEASTILPSDATRNLRAQLIRSGLQIRKTKIAALVCQHTRDHSAVRELRNLGFRI